MKFEDWPERLNDFLTSDHIFDWVNCNCALFAADAVRVQTGVDFAKSYRGPKTKTGMISRLRKICGGDVETAVTKELGDPLSSVLLAKRGDVVSFDFGDGPALGICKGSQGIFVSEHDGIVRVPLIKCHTAWSVE